MLELEQALQIILGGIEPLPGEVISTVGCVRRILAQPILAPASLPAFDNSAMDGFAVRAADCAGASSHHPIFLRQIGQVTAGDPASGTVQALTCMRVFTGAPLPEGADAVVMQEDTATDPLRTDHI